MKRYLISSVLLLLAVVSQAVGRDNYTVIVSMDGFRWDYAECFDTPFFNSVGEQGVKAVMRPSFPSKTFPNHYTLATGLVPDHHGIVANSFWDRENDVMYSLGLPTKTDARFYGGEPIWLTAKHQGVKTATVYWVGSDVAVKGEYPTYWCDYQKKPLLTYEQRVDKVIELLSMPEDERPHLVMCYFEEPDHSGHTFGPNSMNTRKAVEHLDSILSVMWSRIGELPIADKVNFIVTSDHGMATIDSDRTVPVMENLKPEWIAKIDGNLPGMIYCNDGCADSVVDALKNVPHLRVWKKEDIPAYLQYGTHPYVGDVVALPDLGWLFTDGKVKHGGTHGFDPTNADMQVMFRAVGPDFKKGYVKPDKFQNTNVYVLLSHLLGVEPQPTDGNLDNVRDLLAE